MSRDVFLTPGHTAFFCIAARSAWVSTLGGQGPGCNKPGTARPAEKEEALHFEDFQEVCLLAVCISAHLLSTVTGRFVSCPESAVTEAMYLYPNPVVPLPERVLDPEQRSSLGLREHLSDSTSGQYQQLLMDMLEGLKNRRPGMLQPTHALLGTL